MKASDYTSLDRSLFRLGITVVLAAFVAGCETAHEYSLTYKLWDTGVRPSCRPAPDPKLGVFVSETPSNVLVAYDALSEQQDQILRRAYFLHQTNQVLIAARKAPLYVEPSLATNMSAVPVVVATNEVREIGTTARYPVMTDNGPGFELYRDGKSAGAHELPMFNEGAGFHPATRVALTPVAVAGDTVMVGVVTGVVAAYLWVASGCPPFTNGW